MLIVDKKTTADQVLDPTDSGLIDVNSSILPIAAFLLLIFIVRPAWAVTPPTTEDAKAKTGQQPSASRGNASRIPIAGVEKFIADEQARVRARPRLAEKVTVSLFNGPPSQGRSFVFLIDRSNSMARGGLAALQTAEEKLIAALQPLKPTHKFQVIAYHHECLFLGRRELLPATEENKQAVRGLLNGLTATGATEHEMALQTALGHAPDVIYLLTDGGDPELSERQLRKITKLAGTRTSIHCVQVGFGTRQGEPNFLNRLSTLTRGQYQYLDVSHSLK